jgi:dephospho-CoA kinase
MAEARLSFDITHRFQQHNDANARFVGERESDFAPVSRNVLVRQASQKQHSESPEPVCAWQWNASYPAERPPSEIARTRESHHYSHRFPQLPSVVPDHSQQANIPVVGIVGGVAAGKSSVVQSVSDLQLFVIDADGIGHELLSRNEICSQLRDAFGKEICDEAGLVLRKRLAERVFGDSDEQTSNRNRLNEILHPAIRIEIHRCLNQAPQDVDAIILDAALLLEAGWADECDAVIFIDTPIELRQQRAATNRGWSVEEFERREASQWSLLKKREFAEFVVDNSGSLKAAAEQMTRFLKKIIQRHGPGRVLS